VEGENKMLYAKWDSLAKYIGRKKATNDIMIDVKKKDWYYYKVRKHAKNQKLFASHGREFIAIQVAHMWLDIMQKQWSNLPLCCICVAKMFYARICSIEAFV
jgi:hypothetical protein